MRSGLARVMGCALIAVLASCDPLSYGDRAQLAIGDGDIVVDDASVSNDDAPPPPVDAPVEGPVDAPTEGGPVDAPMEAGPDAMIDAPMPMPDAMSDAGVTDGGPGDGSLTDALGPDAREPPGFPVGGSDDNTVKSFYACSTGDGASALPLLLAILALRRRSYRGSGVT